MNFEQYIAQGTIFGATLHDQEIAGLAAVKPVDPAERIDLANATEVGPEMDLTNTLILMACSATKRALADGQTLPLIDLYDGPMWQSLRLHLGDEYQPDGVYRARRYNVVVLSGKFGIIGASAHCKTYEARLSEQRANELISMGLLERQTWFGELKIPTVAPLCELKCPTTRINSTEPLRRLPWKGVIVAGGGDYRRAFMALLKQLMQYGDVDPDARILATHGGIGEQRSQLGQWVAKLVGNTPPREERTAPIRSARDATGISDDASDDLLDHEEQTA
jgi:hypothetical protein